jgi:hypothetical protein
MSDENSLRRIDEMLVAYTEVTDPAQKRRFLRAIVRDLTDEVTQVQARFLKLTSALARAVETAARMEAQETADTARPSDASTEKRMASGEYAIQVPPGKLPAQKTG